MAVRKEVCKISPEIAGSSEEDEMPNIQSGRPPHPS